MGARGVKAEVAGFWGVSALGRGRAQGACRPGTSPVDDAERGTSDEEEPGNIPLAP